MNRIESQTRSRIGNHTMNRTPSPKATRTAGRWEGEGFRLGLEGQGR